ncbi:Fur-regulated basic protein FbpA [Geobacillus thermoleovorans]|uniref:Fur-regulated basic protein FbpA n=1 Tax=Geobacillus TaxID=129337 RepID=UPI0009006B65|nr:MULTISPECIES: Fur-regulated basic protein FbpA [Geobacillus]NNU85272.1 Fur-regulated basic protein FbpA [Geobacillus sp. BMUD]UPT59541.1 Fur-regulated basic protein FbpA [Geobacillus thermoleovorans]
MGKWMQQAVKQQKQFYINQLLRVGLTDDPAQLEHWTIAELRREYERFRPIWTMKGGQFHERKSARAGETHH